MKEIQKEVVTKSYETIYVANDGTEFADKNECKKYDESAAGVLNAMLRKITVKSGKEESIHGYGCEENPIDVLAPTCEEDKKIILQMYLLANPHIQPGRDDKRIERVTNLISRAIAERDYLLVGRGYDYDGFWFYGTRHSMQEELDKFCNVEKKEND